MLTIFPNGNAVDTDEIAAITIYLQPWWNSDLTKPDHKFKYEIHADLKRSNSCVFLTGFNDEHEARAYVAALVEELNK